MVKEQTEGIKQVGATVPGGTGFLGSCACFCKSGPGARRSGKNSSLSVVLLQTDPFGQQVFRFSYVLLQTLIFAPS